MLKKGLEGILSQSELDELFSAFDQVGDIIILRIPDSLLTKKKIIGETLLERVKSANSVFYQSSPVDGDFRTRDLELIAGTDRTETEYREFGCRFRVDVQKNIFLTQIVNGKKKNCRFGQR